MNITAQQVDRAAADATSQNHWHRKMQLTIRLQQAEQTQLRLHHQVRLWSRVHQFAQPDAERLARLAELQAELTTATATVEKLRAERNAI